MLICFLNQNAIYLECVRTISPPPLKEKSPSLFSSKSPSGVHKTKYTWNLIKILNSWLHKNFDSASVSNTSTLLPVTVLIFLYESVSSGTLVTVFRWSLNSYYTYSFHLCSMFLDWISPASHFRRYIKLIVYYKRLDTSRENANKSWGSKSFLDCKN